MIAYLHIESTVDVEERKLKKFRNNSEIEEKTELICYYLWSSLISL